MKINNIKFKPVFYTVALSIIGLYFCFKYVKSRDLYKNYKIVNANIYEINRGSLKGGKIVIKYIFSVNKKEFKSGVDSDLPYDVRDKLLNTYFPVLYDSTNPSNNVLLIFDKRWEELHMHFPDSLQWIKKYYPAGAF
ncbi:hypothetical protein [Ferruginibacter profundus]